MQAIRRPNVGAFSVALGSHGKFTKAARRQGQQVGKRMRQFLRRIDIAALSLRGEREGAQNNRQAMECASVRAFHRTERVCDQQHSDQLSLHSAAAKRHRSGQAAGPAT